LKVGQIESLIGEARGGSAAALGQLLSACRNYLLSLANHHVGASLKVKVGASDLVQETSLEAYRDFVQFRGARLDELLAWLQSILRNNVASAGRRYQVAEKRNLAREVPLEVHLAADGDVRAMAPSPRSLLAEVEEQEKVERAIDLLPLDQRKAILLRHREHLTFAQIGAALDRSTAAAHKLWARAVLRLQKELSNDSDGPPRTG
jgi:RNA polymerase sigma-70 factor (ECF subfamily)